MTALEVRYWPKHPDPAREGALAHVLTSNSTGAMITTYGARTLWASWDELEVLVQTEGD